MPRLIQCLEKSSLSQEEKDFILAKEEALVKQGLPEKDASTRAIKEFQENTLNSLNDIYSQVGLPGYETSVLTTQGATDREAAAPSMLAGKSEGLQDFILKMADEVGVVTDSSFDFRMDIPGMDQEARRQAVNDILTNKPTKRAQNFIDALEDMFNKGEVAYTRSRGKFVDQMTVPLAEWVGLANQPITPLTDEEILELNTEVGEEVFSKMQDEVFENITQQNEQDTRVSGKTKSATSGATEKGQDTSGTNEEKVPVVETGKVVNPNLGNQKPEQVEVAEQVAQQPTATTEEKKTKPTIAQKGKELADKIRELRIKDDKLRSTIFGLPLAIYDTAIVTIANAIELGASLADAIKQGIDTITSLGYGADLTEPEFVQAVKDTAAGKKPKLKVQLSDSIKVSAQQIQEAKGVIAQWRDDLLSGKKISRAAVSLLPAILENRGLLDSMTREFAEYQPETQQEAYDFASHWIELLGATGVKEYLLKERGNIPPLYQTALLVKIIEQYREDGDIKGEADTATLLRQHITSSAQGLQSAKAAYEWLEITDSIEAQKIFLQNVVDSINRSAHQLPEMRLLIEAQGKLRAQLHTSLTQNNKLKERIQQIVKHHIAGDTLSVLYLAKKGAHTATTKLRSKKIADAIRNLKIRPDPDILQSNIFGVFIPLVNTAIDAIALAVEQGGNLIDAIEQALKDIKDKNPKFDLDDEFREYISDRVVIPTTAIKTSEYVTGAILRMVDDFIYNETDYETAVDKTFFYLSDAARTQVKGLVKSEVKKLSKELTSEIKKEYKDIRNLPIDRAIDVAATKILGGQGIETDTILGEVAKRSGLSYITRAQVIGLSNLLTSTTTLEGFQRSERIERIINFLEQQDANFTSSLVRSVMYLKNLMSYTFAFASLVTNKMQLVTAATANTLQDIFSEKSFDPRYFQLLFDKNTRIKANTLAADILLRGGIPIQNMMDALMPTGTQIPKSRLEEYKIFTDKWYKKLYNKIAQVSAAGGNRLAGATDTPVTYRIASGEMYQQIKDYIREANPKLSEKAVEKAAWALMNATTLDEAIALTDAEFTNRGYTLTGKYETFLPSAFAKSSRVTQGIIESENKKQLDRNSTIFRRRVVELMDKKRNEQFRAELDVSIKVASDLLFKERIGDSLSRTTPFQKIVTNGVGGLITSITNGAVNAANFLFGRTKAGKYITQNVIFTFTGYVNSAGNIMERVLEADPRYAAIKILALQVSKRNLTKAEQRLITKRQMQILTNSTVSSMVMLAVLGISNALCGQNVSVTQSSRADGDSQTGYLKICGVEISMRFFPIQARLLEVYGSVMNNPEVDEDVKRNVFVATWFGLTHLGWDFFETDPAQFPSPVTALVNQLVGQEKKFNVGDKKSEAIRNERWQNWAQGMLASSAVNYIPVSPTLTKQTADAVNFTLNEGAKYYRPTGEINRSSLLNFMNGFKQQVANKSGYQSIINTMSGKPYFDYRGRLVDKNYDKKRDAIDDFMGKYESRVNMFSQIYSPIFVEGGYRTMTDSEHRKYFETATKKSDEWLKTNYPKKTGIYQTYVESYGESLQKKGKQVKSEDEYFLGKLTTAQTNIKKAVITEMFGQTAVTNQ